MKRGLLYPHNLRAALALPAAALLLYSCDPPASQLPASPNSAVPEVIKISGLPNMAEIERRLNAQYAASAESTDGVEFDPPSISGTTVSASITYAEGKLLPMTIGGTEHRIKTVTITRVVDGKTIPTTVEYKDKDDTTRKTVTSRYVPPPNAAENNNARQSLEGGPTLHISGEEKDGADKTLRIFTATERTEGGTTILETTYRREGFTKTVTTENGILTQDVETYSTGTTPAKDETKTKTITYEKSAAAMFYPDRQKFTLAMYRDAGGEETKRDEPKDGGSTILTTMRDKSTITTTFPKDNVTLAVYKDPGGTETQRINVETRSDGSTITTKTTAGGGTTKELVIHPSLTAIEDNAFENSGLTSVSMRNGVQSIGKYAFRNNELTTVSIENSVQTVGRGAFRNNELSSVRIGNGLKTIEPEVFRDNKLYSLTIPPSVTAIGYEAFQNNKLISLTIGNGVKTIGAWAFAGNFENKSRGNQLNSLMIPPSVTKIEESAFRNNRLTSLEIPPSVTAIETGAFYNNELVSVSIPPSIESLGKLSFAQNRTLKIVRITGTGPITTKAFTYPHWRGGRAGVFQLSDSDDGITLIIGDGITSIGDSAFAGSDLTSVVIGKSVRTIGSKAFERNQLIAVKIPPSVTAIGAGAFSTNKLTLVILPKALSKTRETAFNGNSAALKFRDHKGRSLGTD